MLPNNCCYIQPYNEPYCPCCCCCATAINPSPPPIAPLPPPVPPVPPGRTVIGEGIFEGIPVTTPAFTIAVPFNGTTQGTGISHTNGESDILLMPNIMYEYSYTATITPDNINMPNRMEAFLGIFNDGSVIPNSTSVLNNIDGTVTFQNSGTFTITGIPDPRINLVITGQSGIRFTLDSSALMIQALQ